MRLYCCITGAPYVTMSIDTTTQPPPCHLVTRGMQVLAPLVRSLSGLPSCGRRVLSGRRRVIRGEKAGLCGYWHVFNAQPPATVDRRAVADRPMNSVATAPSPPHSRPVYSLLSPSVERFHSSGPTLWHAAAALTVFKS